MLPARNLPKVGIHLMFVMFLSRIKLFLTNAVKLNELMAIVADIETTTGSTNTMFRKPLSDITSSHQNQHSISPPLRKLGRPRKITTLPELPINIQTNDMNFAQTSNVVEEVDAEFDSHDLRKTQCIGYYLYI
jgi:L-asparaginase/Glu-tRNA(Gln) amidotransferase subunit D